MKNKKIVVIGERSISESGYAYADSFVEVFSALGHQVVSIDNTYLPAWWRTQDRTFLLSGIERRLSDYWMNRQIVTQVKQADPDIIFVLKGDNLTASTISTLKAQTRARLVLFYPDNPFMLSNGNSNPMVIKSLSLYDVVLSWSLNLMPVLSALGVPHVCYFPFGYDERFFAQSSDVNEKYDVGFIGTADAERVAFMAELMKKLPDVTFGIWGNLWDALTMSDQNICRGYQGAAVYKQGMAGIIRSCRISLNLIRRQNYDSHNMRTLEIPAAGAFQLTCDTYEQSHVLFTKGRSVATFKSISDLINHIKFYLTHDGERIAIAAEGKKRAQYFTLQRMLQAFLANDLCFCLTSDLQHDSLGSKRCVRLQ